MAEAKQKPKKQKKPLTKAKWQRKAIITAVIAAVVIVALNVVAGNFKAVLDKYVGAAESTVNVPAEAANWDTTYYESKYRGRNQATQAGNEIVKQVEGEGIVLLKNDNGTLPLDTSKTVSLIGRYAADPVYGGAGSGTVDPSSCINLYQGLADAGFTINDTAYGWINDNYDNYDKAAITMDDPTTASYYIGEIPFADYSADAQASLDGTTAVVVLGRGGGEGGDLSRDLKATLDSGVSSKFTANNETANYEDGQHELELTKEEKDLLAAAKEHCDKVVVVLNMSTTMELGPLVDPSSPYAADAIIEVGSLGATGADAVGQVLAGAVNPSGKTTDLWAADFTADPTFHNFGSYQYTDISGYYTQTGDKAYFVEYEEGIYYGYRYYETAAVEAANGNYDGFDYDTAVVYPFGYGLSYTTFNKSLDSVTVDGEDVVANVTITNTGSVAGKDVAEVYYSAPYTPGGLEKSAVVLGGFEKTKLLEPGESQTLTVTFPVRSMASYSSDEQAYVLDAGDYVVSLRSDSHTVLAEQTLTLDADKYTTDSATGNEISNKFDDTTQYMEKNCKTFSRADFAGTFPDGAQDKTTADAGITIEKYDYKAAVDDSATMPTTGADNGVSLIDLRGKDYDDPMWDQLLDQLTADDMVSMFNEDAYNTPALGKIAKPETKEPDGPAGFTSLMGPTGNTSYCSEVVMAQTWNKELMRLLGQTVGDEALASGYNGWYAPAMNTHRSPFAGRNFEYYSEDPVLAGELASQVVAGCAEKGCYAMIKHFALNDQETNRNAHIMTWATEQTIREIYLKPFEYCVKGPKIEMKYLADENGTVATKEMPPCTAVMSSFNYIGTEWAGGRKSLLTGILRDEWGFQGVVITDFNLYDYMDKMQSVYAGGDIQLTYSAMTGPFADTTSASAVTALRTAAHNLLFTVANSNAMNGFAPGTTITYGIAPWQLMIWGVSAVVGLIALLVILLSHKRVPKDAK